MRGVLLGILCASALLASIAATPARAAVSVGVNIQVGRRAPVYFAREPRAFLVPGTRVYYVDDPNYDVYRWGDSWFADDGNYWYQSRSYRGPFLSMSFSSVPREIIQLPGRYQRHRAYGRSGYSGYGGYDNRYGSGGAGWQDQRGNRGRSNQGNRDWRNSRDQGNSDWRNPQRSPDNGAGNRGWSNRNGRGGQSGDPYGRGSDSRGRGRGNGRQQNGRGGQNGWGGRDNGQGNGR